MWPIKDECDVLIVGSGVAGLTAGLAALAEKQDVQVVSSGQGATAMSSGVVDLCGYYPDGSLCLQPLKGIKAWGEVKDHIYAVLKVGEDVLAPGLGFFQDQISPYLTYAGNLAENMYLPTTLGTYKPTCLAPVTAAGGNLRELDGNVFVVGFNRFPDFAPDFVVRSLTDLLQRGADTWCQGEIVWKSQRIDLPFLSQYPYVSAAELAQLFDRKENLVALLEELQDLVEKGGAAGLGLPPVMGYSKAEENIRHLRDELGVPVFELLPVTHSIPGLRFQEALQKAFYHKGGRRPECDFTATALNYAGDRVELIGVCRSEEVRVAGKKCVVATGDYIGGGLQVSLEGVKVPILDLLLPLPAGGLFQREVFPRGGHPGIRYGLRVNGTLQPLNLEGKPVAENIFAAGAVLGGYDYVRELSGLGTAIITGFLAGKNAATPMTGSEQR
jgi:glycerol-3-phosphate dehydrogenase subunit B